MTERTRKARIEALRQEVRELQVQLDQKTDELGTLISTVKPGDIIVRILRREQTSWLGLRRKTITVPHYSLVVGVGAPLFQDGFSAPPDEVKIALIGNDGRIDGHFRSGRSGAYLLWDDLPPKVIGHIDDWKTAEHVDLALLQNTGEDQ